MRKCGWFTSQRFIMAALPRFADEPPMIAFRYRGPATVTTRLVRAWVLLALVYACCGTGHADELTIEIDGVRDPLRGNVHARVDALQVSGGVRLSQRRLERIAEQAERQALLALRPYGYYRAGAKASTISTGPDRNCGRLPRSTCASWLGWIGGDAALWVAWRSLRLITGSIQRTDSSPAT